MAAKGWISVQCQLYNVIQLYKTKPTTRNKF